MDAHLKREKMTNKRALREQTSQKREKEEAENTGKTVDTRDVCW